MIRRLTAVFPLAAALVAGGCDGLFGPKELGGDLRELEGTVEFLVREIHGPVGDEVGPPQLALYMVTEHVYSCIGHRIETDVDVAGGVVTVAIAGVREPDICIDTDYPAEFREILGIGEGEWTLRFVNGDRTRDFDLTVDATSIVVGGAGDAFMSPMYELFWRYPETSFAVGCDRTGGDGEAKVLVGRCLPGGQAATLGALAEHDVPAQAFLQWPGAERHHEQPAGRPRMASAPLGRSERGYGSS